MGLHGTTSSPGVAPQSSEPFPLALQCPRNTLVPLNVRKDTQDVDRDEEATEPEYLEETILGFQQASECEDDTKVPENSPVDLNSLSCNDYENSSSEHFAI